MTKAQPVAFRPKADVTLSTRTGLITMRAWSEVRDPILIDALKRANVQLEPIYD